ncbi:MAG: hypothetical protein QMB94_05105, partial [Phycisphaerales bacterium]
MSDQPSSLRRLEFDGQQESAIHRSWLGIAIKFALVLVVLGAIFFVWQTWIQPQDAQLDAALKRLGPWGPVLFIGIFLVTTSIFFPESVLA